ncbi:MAG: cyclic nucleotide-binding domain-containing protein, partial [Deltaproteobacteria bacterium]|nr:cyclic nucleotide-binding domain-containing protein [Deltaproteobacteria bacterium]
KKKDFVRAEAMRDRLFEVAPMALNEITKSGDIIDEEKSHSIDDTHRETWAALYSTLTTEEANDLYFALKENIYKEGDVIFKTGDKDNRLYFYESGDVKMFFLKDNKDAVKILEPGDTAGKDTFFYSTAYRTFTLIAGTKAKLRSLDREILGKWKDKFPGLEKKLNDYCFRSGGIPEYLKKNRIDRRRNKRKNLSGKVAVQLLDPSGAPTGKQFVGALSDLSMSGLSFTFKLSNNDVAHKLLGVKTKTQLVIPEGGSSRKIEQTGKIVGIGYHVLADHSLHVRFDKVDESIKKLIGE